MVIPVSTFNKGITRRSKLLPHLFSSLSRHSGRRGFHPYSSSLPAGKTIHELLLDNFIAAQNQSQNCIGKKRQRRKSFAITFMIACLTGSGFWHYVAYNLPVDTNHVDIGD
jgi:hypothetical protein